jgi:hypothetical protein
MKNCRTRCFLLMLICAAMLALPRAARAWGQLAHETVARSSVNALPPTLQPFFGTSGAFMAAVSAEPDTRREHDPAERYRHYLDIDLLPREDWDELPSDLEAAKEKYGEEKLRKTGNVPWRIAEMTAALSTMMKEGRWDGVRRTAAWLSHYVADAHQPLHCTVNYDGKQTGNDGIHTRFEIEMADAYVVTPLVAVEAAEEVQDVFRATVQVCIESNELVPQLLAADDRARAAAPLDTPAYYEALAEASGELARRRIAASAQMTGNLIYTAWVQAGRPELPTDRVTVVVVDRGPMTSALQVAQAAHQARLTFIKQLGDAHDGLALRVVGPSDGWSRTIRFGQVTSLAAGLVPLRAENPSALYHYLQRAGPWPRAARRLRDEFGVTITPGPGTGVAEAMEQLRAFPGVERQVVLVSDGVSDDKYLDIELLKTLKQKGEIHVRLYAVDEESMEEGGLKALAEALGVELQRLQ